MLITKYLHPPSVTWEDGISRPPEVGWGHVTNLANDCEGNLHFSLVGCSYLPA